MDQMASSVGNIITIDFADPAHPDVEPVAVDFSRQALPCAFWIPAQIMPT